MVYCSNCAKCVSGIRPGCQLCCNQCGKVLEDYYFSCEVQFIEDPVAYGYSSKINQDAVLKLFEKTEAAVEPIKQLIEMHSDVDYQNIGNGLRVIEGRHQTDKPGPKDGYNDEKMK